MTKSCYEVGYGKPPLQTRFRKGKSGNPKRRGTGTRNFAAIFMEPTETDSSLRCWAQFSIMGWPPSRPPVPKPWRPVSPSGDVIRTVLARRQQPLTPPSITTPDALRLKIEPAADCGRYDGIRKIA